MLTLTFVLNLAMKRGGILGQVRLSIALTTFYFHHLIYTTKDFHDIGSSFVEIIFILIHLVGTILGIVDHWTNGVLLHLSDSFLTFLWEW